MMGARARFLTFLPGYILVWITLTAILAARLDGTATALVWSVASFLLHTHIVFAGYFTFMQDYARPGIRAFFLPALIGLVAMSWFARAPLVWLLSLALLFSFAVVFHSLLRGATAKIWFQEFCNYKIYIEISGITGALLGAIILLLLPGWSLALGIVTVLYTLSLNWKIFHTKRLYSIRYEVPELPEEPLVSVVVIAYNEEKFIGATLDAITRLDYPRLEVIVVDDHSKDRTVEIAQAFASRLDLRVVQKEQRGISLSRNYGASLAKGEIILFLDADTLVPEDFLKIAVPQFKARRLGLGIVDFEPITEKRGDLVYTNLYRLWLRLVQYHDPHGIGFSLLVLKTVHDRVLFDPGVFMSEDFDYTKRAAALTKCRIIEGTKTRASWRRFDKENRLILVMKYLCFEWRRQHIGEIRKMKSGTYSFGNFG
jgi:hypothetical protein